MTSPPENDRWTEIDALFESALEVPPEARAAFLDEATDDAELRAAVLALLRSGEEAERWFEPAAERLAGPVWEELEREVEERSGAGERIGAYRLLGVLGRGGMGTVYLAERADGRYEQRVALKLLRRSVDTDELLERFLAERQILAGLQHPNVARLLDGGEAPDGRPFLVMEHVDGEPIDAYCDARRLGVAERLRLFKQVGAAVRYAHRSLVVHRDLKPSNILVTADGTVKLLDFGIAKLLDGAPASGSAPETRAGAWVMTPEYASPEQVRGEPVTTASDVYQLGLLLYGLLTGERPYEVGERSPGEVERVVCDTEPDAPSTRVRRAADDGAPRARRSTPAELARALRGDLDTIVLKALRKEPDRRYESAAEMVHDVERHLDDRPVHARPASIRYRAGKFVRRHRGRVAAGALVALLLLAYGLTAGIQAQRMREQRDRIRLEAQRAEEVTRFLSSLFTSADPAATAGETPTVRELLDRGAARIEVDLAGQPAARAQLMSVLGETYHALSLYPEASPLLEGAAAESAELYGPSDDRTIEARLSLAELRRSQGRYPEADSLIHAVLADLDARGVRGGALRANAVVGLAKLEWLHQDFEAADSLYRRGAALSVEAMGARHPYVAATYAGWGQMLADAQEHERAETLLRRSLSIREETLDPLHPAVASSMATLADLLGTRSEYAEADSLLRAALAIHRQTYEGDHSSISNTLVRLAQLREAQGDVEGAEAYARESLAMVERLFPDTHRHALTLALVGRILMGAAEYGEAEAMYRRAMGIYEEVFGEDYPAKTVALYNLATIYHESGRLDEAERLFRQVVRRDREAYGDGHSEVGVDLNRLAAVLRDAGDLREAETVYREAMRILERELREDHPRVASVKIGLGGTLTRLGKADEAEPLLREGLALREEIFQEESWQMAEAKTLLGSALAALGRPAAGPLLTEGYETMRRVRGPDDRRTRAAREALAALP